MDNFTLALLLSGIVYISLAIFVQWYYSGSPGAKSFVGLMVAAFLYSVGYYCELHSPDLNLTRLCLKIEYLGIAPLTVLFLIFVLQYTKRDRYLKLWVVAVMFIIPAITYLLVFTSDYNHFFYRSMTLVSGEGLSLLYTVKGPWYWIHIGYLNLVLIIANGILLHTWKQTPSPLNRQYSAMFWGSMVPWGGLIIFISGNSPLNLDLSPFGMVISGLIYLYSIVYYRFFDIFPVASTIVLDKMRDGVIVIDDWERIMNMNTAAVKFFGPEGNFIGREIAHLFNPVSGDMVSVANAVNGQMEIEQENGNDREWLDLTFSPLSNREAQMRGHAVIVRDITKRKLAQKELQRTNNELHERVQQLNQYNWEINLLNRLTVQLQQFNQLADAYPVIINFMQQLLPHLGGGLYIYSPEYQEMELVCVWNRSISMPTEFGLDDCLGLSRQAVHRTQEHQGICKHVKNSNGFQYACHPVIIEDEPFALLHYYYQSAQISAYQLNLARIAADTVKLALANLRMKEKLREDSIRDSLTGLFNRRYMIETLNLEIAQAERTGRPLAVIMADIDNYKNINDRFGHAVGDHVLFGVSRVLQENIRRGDIACRYGGDEFVLVMPGVSLEVGMTRAESIRAKIEHLDFSFVTGDSGRISVSLGVATFPQQAEDVESLLKAADNALYVAKGQGRNQTVAAQHDWK